jgi:hypothetical protein
MPELKSFHNVAIWFTTLRTAHAILAKCVSMAHAG